MNKLIFKTLVACCLFSVVSAGTPPLHAEDLLDSARELYASAEYETALELLERLSVGTAGARDRQGIELYRALCLVAVGRQSEADRAIETMIEHDPLYQPSPDLPPRVRAAFIDVKGRLLPAIVQEDYAQAKVAFDNKQYEVALGGFTRVLTVLNDPQMADAAAQPPLADIRTLAAGFRDLSARTIPPPPPPAPVAPPVPPTPPQSVREVYTGEDADVIPPQAIRQELPAYPGAVPAGGIEGLVEVLIDEDGTVASATMAVPLRMAAYNKNVLSAARQWRYQPATLNGRPVKYRKGIRIEVVAPPQ